MTKIKLCGIQKNQDICAVNELKPDFIGFVFSKMSKRFISDEKAKGLKSALNNDISAVGVFVDEPMEHIIKLLNENVIDMVQLHGKEDEIYIRKLKSKTNKPIIKAFCMNDNEAIKHIETCIADYVLLDSGAGTGKTFDWNLLKNIKRDIFLAGGLDDRNVSKAIHEINPYAVDVSSGIEIGGCKDKNKMTAFVNAVRKEGIE